VQFAGDLVPPFTYPRSSVPVRLVVHWTDGTSTRCEGETGCWNVDAVYCKFHPGDRPRARVGWFAAADVTRLTPAPGPRRTSDPHGIAVNGSD
jgi:hypothetical protein